MSVRGVLIALSRNRHWHGVGHCWERAGHGDDGGGVDGRVDPLSFNSVTKPQAVDV